MKQSATSMLLAGAAGLLAVSVASAQTRPARAPAAPAFKNLKVLPKSISRADLSATMKSFSQSLGVRCTHCHVGEEGKPLSTYDFASDKKVNKAIARDMMKLVRRLNGTDLAAMGLIEAQVTCYTCHRGAKEPARTPPKT